MKKLLWFAAPFLLALGVMAGGMPGFSASAASPPAPPGQGDCSHGNTGKACRPDPSTNGQDCAVHGNNGIGGVNEDHCLATTPVTTTNETTTTNEATTTNKTETTPVSTTATDDASTTSQTATTATSRTTTNGGQSKGTPSTSVAPATKPQLERELAKQAVRRRTGGVSPERTASGQLPFTGFPIWILALVGSALLVAGFAIRRRAA